MKRTLSIMAALLMTGCHASISYRQTDHPYDLMEPPNGMLVVKVGRPDVTTVFGDHFHEYMVQDGSGESFLLCTKSEFKLGDFVEFTKQRPFP